MLEKINKGIVGGISISMFLVLYHEIQQTQETLRRIELAIQYIHKGFGTGLRVAGSNEGETVQRD